jgi:L-aspartate oxidase
MTSQRFFQRACTSQVRALELSPSRAAAHREACANAREQPSTVLEPAWLSGVPFPRMPAAPSETDFLVIGAGIAGLRAAIELAPAGRVTLLAKREIANSSTQYAQGGIAAALSDEDEISLHLQDTLNAGDGLCSPEAARVLVEDAPERMEELIAWGTQFDREGTKLAFGREGAHSRNRILHAHGDSTGREIQRALYAKVRTLPEVSVREFEFSIDLVAENGRVVGVRVIDEHGAHSAIFTSAVLLATGGMGQLYLNTTNPSVATGDGIAMAYRAGAEVTDLEFIQFHPTALYLKGAPRFLLSEAIRGEGAYLRNMEMMRFMPKYHPMGELAPRDVVARAIMHELERSRAKEPVVYLDLTHLEEAHIRKRFPRIYSTCLEFNIDITSELVPIRPAAHYSMGGVRTDLDGRATLPGLYAAGEAAGSGVHGANRLASNSLLEGLVFGARAGEKMRDELKAPMHRASDLPPAAYSNGPLRMPVDIAIGEVQELMWKHAGIVRTGSGLKQAIARLEQIGEKMSRPQGRREFEARNLQLAGLLVARSALAREESRGAHYRADFPDHNDAHFRKHSVVRNEKIRFE